MISNKSDLFLLWFKGCSKDLKTKDQVELNLIEIILSQYLW